MVSAVLIISAILAGIVFLIAVFYAIKFFKVRRARKKAKIDKANLEREKILADLDWCERRYAEENGEINPNAILWELAKRHREDYRATNAEDTRIRAAALSTPVIRREDVPFNAVKHVVTNQSEHIEDKPVDRRKSLFRRK